MTLTRFGIFMLVLMGASVTPVRAEDTQWVTIFEESFEDNPMERFKIMSVPEPGTTSSVGSGRYDEMRQAYSLDGRLSVVRPLRAGPHVEFGLTLRFSPPGSKDPPDLVTDLMLVLFDKSAVGIQVHRGKQSDAPTIVKFAQKRSVPAKIEILREVQLPDATLDGAWLLRYRHGLLTLIRDDDTIGSVDAGRLGVSVAGVSWAQKGGQVACQRMFVKGEPLREVSPEGQELLRKASGITKESLKLFQEKKYAEALVKMTDASALFVEVHGENHHDSANSFTNLATILGAMGNRNEAGPLWAKALMIHEKTLGANHPHTTLTRFNQGKYLLGTGDKAQAKELWTRCRDDWKAVLGPEYSLVKSLDAILLQL